MRLRALMSEFLVIGRGLPESELEAFITLYVPRFEDCFSDGLLLTEKQVVEKNPALSLSMLRNLRQRGKGPKFIKLGKHRNSRIFYRTKDLESWLDSFDEL